MSHSKLTMALATFNLSFPSIRIQLPLILSIRIHSQSFIEVLRSQPTRIFTIFTFPSSSLAYSQSLCICAQLWISQSLINWLLVLTIPWSELKAIATTLPLNLLSDYCLILPPFQNKNYTWWNFSQSSPNELECCQKQCKYWCWWTTKSNNSLHLFNNLYLDSTTLMQHQRNFTCFGAICRNWRASNKIGAKSYLLHYGHP
jgi:hypothetical protein